MKEFDIAALVGSRICHDLISPIGAIGNGFELVAAEFAEAGPEMALIGESVTHAKARIRFFRVAFGSTGDDQRLGKTEVTSILRDLFHSGRITLDAEWPLDLTRRDLKLIFLLIMCLETALAYGGRITIRRENDRWSVEGAAERLRVEPALWACLADPQPDPDVGPAHVQFLLVQAELKRQHRRMTSEIGERDIRFSL